MSNSHSNEQALFARSARRSSSSTILATIATAAIGLIAKLGEAMSRFKRNLSEFIAIFGRAMPSWLSAAVVTVLGLGVCPPASVQAQDIEWTRLSEAGPSPRWGHAMAYDAARSVTVLFGGYGFADTWEWNGVTWTQRSVSGPSARYRHAMAYDSVRHVTILFGGYDQNADTWEWDGTTWTRRGVIGPSSRSGHAMAFDSSRGVTVLFGGSPHLGVLNGETWEWNGSAWTRRFVTGPTPRSGHTMAYDSARAVTVLYSGSVGGVNSGETWEWNGTTWTQLLVASPSLDSGYTMAYDASRGVTILFGRDSTGVKTWEWNGTTWTLRATEESHGPSSRRESAMTYDAARAVSLLFGGWADSGYSRETWVLGAPCDPPTLSIHPVDQVAGIGGSAIFTAGAPGSLLGYQWQLNGVNLTNTSRISGATSATLTITNTQWADQGSYACLITNPCGTSTSLPGTLSISSCPPSWVSMGDTGFGQRWVHAQAYSAVNAGTLVFGGRDASNNVLGDTWLKKNGAWSNRAVTGPAPRSDHAMAALANGHVLLFGGKSAASGSGLALGDTWEWNGNVWMLASTTGPAARFGHAMALDSSRGRVVMFGGLDSGGTTLGDTWEWTGTSWAQVASTGPSARFAHIMAFDPVSGETLLVSGLGSTSLNDTWAWNGISWRQAAVGGFAPRYYSSGAFDPQLGRVLMLGGVTAAGVVNDSYGWNGTSWSSAGFSASPTARWTHAMSYDATSRSMVLSGGAGIGSVRFSDWWEESGLPIVTSQPRDVVLDLGANAVFSVGVSRPGVTYQWRKDGVAIADAGRFSGATTSTLTISGVEGSDIGGYDCVISNLCGTTTSHSALLAPAVLYVNAAAAAGGNGFSWANAFRDLQDALDAMRANTATRQIWVAQGTYRPDRGTRNRAATFQLIGGVTLIGGFVGTESEASQRDPVAHLTVLTGNLGAAPSNSFRVVTAQSLTAPTEIVGFTITSAIVDDFIGAGGAIYAESSRLNIADCILTQNFGRGPFIGGGTAAGLFARAGSDIRMTNCRIVRNGGEPGGYEASPYGLPGGSGWGVICDQSSLVLTNCLLAENTGGDGSAGSCTAGVGHDGGSGGDGGGLSLTGSSTATVTNCVFVGNSPGRGGGSPYCNVHTGVPGVAGVGGAVSLSGSTITLTNSTFASNSSAIVGLLSGSTLRNCIVWNNLWYNAMIDPGASVQYSSLPQAFPGAGNRTCNPGFADMAGADHVVGTQDDDLRLAATSPCIDAGDNTALAAWVLFDLGGEARFVNAPFVADTGIAGGAGGSAIVDMGAYEHQSHCLGDYNGDGGIDGSDVSAFFLDWEAGDSAADVNADGGIDGSDVSTFFLHWEAGC